MAVAAAVAAGPIAIDPGIVEFVRALDPAALTDEDFDGLLAAVGMAGGGGVGLPDSMAEINALLDLAAPALREALLSAFLDRLTRPVRVGASNSQGISGFPPTVPVVPDRGAKKPGYLGKHVTRERPRQPRRKPARRPRLGRGTGAGGRPDRTDGRSSCGPRSRPGGRTCRPATTSCGRSSAARGRQGAGRRAGPVPDARPPGRAQLLGGAGRAAAAEEPGQHLHRAGRRPRRRAAGATATCRRGPTPGCCCSTGASPSRRAAGLAPRQGLGGGHRAGDPRPGARGGPLAAILWGRDAQALKPMLGGVPWVESAHPSPLSAHRGFFGSKPFSRVNRMLTEQGGTPVDWRLP